MFLLSSISVSSSFSFSTHLTPTPISFENSGWVIKLEPCSSYVKALLPSNRYSYRTFKILFLAFAIWGQGIMDPTLAVNWLCKWGQPETNCWFSALTPKLEAFLSEKPSCFENWTYLTLQQSSSMPWNHVKLCTRSASLLCLQPEELARKQHNKPYNAVDFLRNQLPQLN